MYLIMVCGMLFGVVCVCMLTASNALLVSSAVVVVRLSVHVHFNLGLSPQNSCVPGQRPSVRSLSLTVSV